MLIDRVSTRKRFHARLEGVHFVDNTNDINNRPNPNQPLVVEVDVTTAFEAIALAIRHTAVVEVKSSLLQNEKFSYAYDELATCFPKLVESDVSMEVQHTLSTLSINTSTNPLPKTPSNPTLIHPQSRLFINGRYMAIDLGPITIPGVKWIVYSVDCSKPFDKAIPQPTNQTILTKP